MVHKSHFNYQDVTIGPDFIIFYIYIWYLTPIPCSESDIILSLDFCYRCVRNLNPIAIKIWLLYMLYSSVYVYVIPVLRGSWFVYTEEWEVNNRKTKIIRLSSILKYKYPKQTNKQILYYPQTLQCTRGQNIKQIHRNRRQ